MFFDQLLIFIFVIIIFLLRFNIKITFNNLLFSVFQKNLLNLFWTTFYFYIQYILNYFTQSLTLVKWVSTNYADSYWSLYSCKLNNNFHNIFYKK